jgi:hypothetical protein
MKEDFAVVKIDNDDDISIITVNSWLVWKGIVHLVQPIPVNPSNLSLSAFHPDDGGSTHP